MSIRYKGGIISATPPTLVAGAGASGAWTLEQQMQATAAGLWPVNGPFYIEEVFSTYLYTGNGGTQTITNGINLATKGGLWWGKSRSTALGGHGLVDTVRGKGSLLQSNTDAAAFTVAGNDFVTSFNTTGVTIGNDNTFNRSGATTVGWTFAKQPKFFDVVTYTGDGVAGRTVSHSLGSVPGCIIIKKISVAGSDWITYHRGLASPAGSFMNLNLTSAVVASTTIWNNTAPTSSVFSLGSNTPVNGSGVSYVAYLFAHDAGGFGLTGTDNVVSCGSFSFAAGKATVTIGYEPQYLLLKRTSGVEQWWVFDVMRGMTASLTGNNYLGPNTTAAEADLGSITQPTATGFYLDWSNNGITTGDYIYVAIRRGPMKTPTVGTSVFAPVVQASASPTLITTNFPVDMSWMRASRASVNQIYDLDRLRGNDKFLETTTSNAEQTYSGGWNFQSNVGVNDVAWSSSGAIWWNFQRAPGFFDEVCYTGDGVAGRTISHNLTVVPELMIVKKRSSATSSDWLVYSATLGNANFIKLNLTDGYSDSISNWNNTTPTASVFTVGSGTFVNLSAQTYVSYLFATCAGVSKVGSYTGTGALQTVNCGFTSGARFVLIKRTDSAGDWWTYDSARGISSGNDPYLFLNSTAAEVTGTNYVDTDTTGFKVTAAAPAGLNAVGGTYIFLAIA
jgi:hypothetical protein